MAASFPPPSGYDQASSLTSSAFMLASRFHEDSDDDVDSLPSQSASDSSLGADFYSDDGSESESDADEEWRESMEQLEQLLSMVIVPFVGKFLGRKCAYWGWNKFMGWKYPVEVVIGGNALSQRSRKQKAAASL